MKYVLTGCRICGARCGIVVKVEGDRVISVRGDKEHPISRGFTCVKGRALADLHHHPDRLDHPLARRNGAFERTTWDVAIDEIASKIDAIRKKHGANAIALYWGSYAGLNSLSFWVVRRFMRALGSGSIFSTLSLDAPAKSIVSYEMTGFAKELTPLADWDNTECLLLLGTNPAVSLGHGYAAPMGLAAIRGVKRRGARVIVVDPRITESSREADIHVQPVPGTDHAFLQAVLGVLFKEQAWDALYVDKHCSGLGELRNLVRTRSLSDLARECGVPVKTIEEVARTFASVNSAAAIVGTGLTFAATGNLSVWFAYALNAMTGNFDAKGGVYFNRGLIRPYRTDASRRGVYAGRRSRVRDVESLNGEMPSLAMADEILTDGPGQIRALIAHGGNPVIVMPNQARMEQALNSLDLLISMDIFLSQTAQLAHYVLPGADCLERVDVSNLGETAFPVPFAQIYQRAVEPMGERRNEWTVYAELSKRLGLGLDFEDMTEEEMIASICRESEASVDELVANPHGVVKGEIEYGWILDDFQTPDGRLALAPARLVDEYKRLETPDESAEFPYRLIARRMLSVFNTTLGNVPSAGGRADFNPLLMNRSDAGALGVSDGERVGVRSQTGWLEAIVEVTDEVRPGVVSLPHGWGPLSTEDEGKLGWRGANVNLITDDRTSYNRLTGMPRYTAIPVLIERLV
jgi:anaerobic selenocysteine-containing dehydrogenase